MLSISMAGNVISCKKDQKKCSKNKIAEFTINSAPELGNEQKSPKKRITQLRFAQFFFYRYGIFWMPPGESSHPGGSEYVWQRGVEGISGQVTGGRT